MTSIKAFTVRCASAWEKEYGIASRFALSYDSTFLVLMMLGLEDECTPFQPGKCVFNPLKNAITVPAVK